MKQGVFISITLFIVVCMALASFGWWCISTTEGTRWLLNLSASVTDIEISADRLEGGLADQLLAEGIKVTWEDGQVIIGRLNLDVGSFELMRGRLQIDALEIDRLILRIADEEGVNEAKVRIRANEAATNFVLDSVPGWLNLELTHLDISDFIYEDFTDPTDQVVIAERISGNFLLGEKHLVAKSYSYHSPYVQIDGDYDWELTKPHLSMQANFYLPETVVDPQLFESIRVPVRFPAQLELDGTWDGYTGPVQIGQVGAEGDAVWVTSEVAGSWEGIHLKDLKGRYLNGGLKGDLDLAWIDDFLMKGHLTGTEFDPARLVEELSGTTSLDVSGQLFVPYNDNPIETDFKAEIREAHLRGHNIQGRAAAKMIGINPINLDVDLTTEGSRVLARGLVEDRVELDINIAELEDFHPEISGTVVAQGWGRLQQGLLTGEVTGHGEQLTWMDGAVDTIRFKGLHLEPGAAIEVEIEGSDWFYQELHVTSAKALLTGDPSSHHLQVVAESDMGQYELRATGQQQEKGWSGLLKELSTINTPLGDWSTAAPTQVDWQDGAISVANLQLQSPFGEQFAISMDRWGSEEESSIDLEWKQARLDWLAEEFGIKTLAVKTDGELHYKQAQSKPLQLEGQIKASGQVEDEYYQFAFDDFSAEIDWNQDGLQLTANAQSKAGELLKVQATSQQPPIWSWPLADLKTDLEMRQFNLTRMNRFIEDIELEGQADGTLDLEIVESRPIRIIGDIKADGRMAYKNNELPIRSLSIDIDWDDDLFKSVTRIENSQGGEATLQLSSLDDPGLLGPASGQIELKMGQLDLTALKPFLPQDMDVIGALTGNANGHWLDRKNLALEGQLELIDSELVWLSGDGQTRLPINDAIVEWTWEGDSLNGNLNLNLAEEGYIRGDWQVPLAARLPLQINPGDPLKIEIDGKMQSRGLLSSIRPLMVQNGHGELETHLQIGGTWSQPDMQGNLTLGNGNAYFPALGIKVEDFQFNAELAGQKIRITDLSLRSGPGELTGQGELILDQWQLAEYQLAVAGQQLEFLDFPEVNALIDPDLTFSGTQQKFSMQGSIGIPKLVIKGNMESPKYKPNEDVVIITTDSQSDDLDFEVDVRVAVNLGEKVTLKMAGIETSFSGGSIITMDTTGKLLAWGEIQLESGTYNAYGARLKIKQGLLNYSGTPITNPQLSIFAVREVGNVEAGVHVTGSAEIPVVTLYSRPAMPERDILGYMLTGRALDSDNQQGDMIAIGAGAILPQSKGLEKIGITEIDVSGLFDSDGSGGVRLIHRLSGQWELQSTLGRESGLDLFYVLEFD